MESESEQSQGEVPFGEAPREGLKTPEQHPDQEAPPKVEDSQASPQEQALDPQEQALDPRSISVHRLSASIAAALVCGTSLPLVVGIAVSWPPGRLLLPLAWVLVTTLLTLRAWWWPAARYRHIAYRLDARALVIRRGVFWRSVTLVPRTRVQHTDVTQGPIERHFGLGTLVVHTAGTQFAAVPLGGLTYERALELRDLLTDDGSTDAV